MCDSDAEEVALDIGDAQLFVFRDRAGGLEIPGRGTEVGASQGAHRTCQRSAAAAEGLGVGTDILGGWQQQHGSAGVRKEARRTPLIGILQVRWCGMRKERRGCVHWQHTRRAMRPSSLCHSSHDVADAEPRRVRGAAVVEVAGLREDPCTLARTHARGRPCCLSTAPAARPPARLLPSPTPAACLPANPPLPSMHQMAHVARRAPHAACVHVCMCACVHVCSSTGSGGRRRQHHGAQARTEAREQRKLCRVAELLAVGLDAQLVVPDNLLQAAFVHIYARRTTVGRQATRPGVERSASRERA